MEGNIHYLFELRNNRASRFLFCSMWYVEEKRFSLVFPEGRGFLRGWKILSNKLRSLGVSLAIRREEDAFASSKKVLAPNEGNKRKKGLVAKARSCSFVGIAMSYGLKWKRRCKTKMRNFLKVAL